MSLVILYENDFARRETMEKEFRQMGYTIDTCYSLPKLELIKRRKENGELFVFINQNHPDYEYIKTHFSDVFPFQPHTMRQDLNAFITHMNSSSHFQNDTGKYKLDLLCIGSSTGGLPVLQDILRGIKQKETITILCQHVGKSHSQNIKDTLQKSIKGHFEIVETTTQLHKGVTYVLSGGSDFVLRTKYNNTYLEPVGLTEAPYHPSFDTLVDSLTRLNDLKAGCIILSGLGDDGSKHLKLLKSRQIKLLAQDPQTATAPYMPRAAISTGQIDHIYNASQLHDFIKRSVA